MSIKSRRKPAMHRAVQIILFITLGLFSSRAAAPGEPPSVPPAQPTPIPIGKVPLQAQTALASLQEIGEGVSNVQSDTDTLSASLSNLTSELDPRMAEEMRLLMAKPSLDLLYRMKLSWQDLGDKLSRLARDLTKHAESLDEDLARLERLNTEWQATLQLAEQQDVPPQTLQSVQNIIASIGRTRQLAETERAEVLTVLSRVLDWETAVRGTLSSIERSQIRTLKGIFLRDSPPIWGLGAVFGREMGTQTGQAMASQMEISTAFMKRLPYAFLIHACVVALIAAALLWMRHQIRELAKEKPDLQRAMPILAFPISTAFVLSVFISPLIYPQAPRLIQTILATLALLPAAMILRRLLSRSSLPVLHALVIMYLADQVRNLAASLPQLARLLFLAEMLGGSLFLLWMLGHRYLEPATKSNLRFSRPVQAIAMIGLVFLPAALLANALGYIDLGNLLAIIFLRGIYAAALLYAAVRILEGLIIIALEVKPLSLLRVVNLHRSMFQRRVRLALQMVAVLFWFYLMLGFFGLLNPILAAAKATLSAGIGMGSLNISLGSMLAFLIAIWASFLLSRFLRFILEEDVYQHFRLPGGIPYAISTMVHYAVLLVGFFVALGVLGIDLTKITILAGAFSVGIGFGLQNVINNFVSGLILLFERPIKIGDVIEVGGNVGEVRRIGIRASVIRTTDGSEVIVPNASLISSQVTNWTFSDRGRAVEVSVSVAGGASVHRVTELLKTTAAGHPDVAEQPAPQVYVANLTASVITFQLRVWTDRHEAWARLRSDLSIAVNDALAREKIAIV